MTKLINSAALLAIGLSGASLATAEKATTNTQNSLAISTIDRQSLVEALFTTKVDSLLAGKAYASFPVLDMQAGSILHISKDRTNQAIQLELEIPGKVGVMSYYSKYSADGNFIPDSNLQTLVHGNLITNCAECTETPMPLVSKDIVFHELGAARNIRLHHR